MTTKETLKILPAIGAVCLSAGFLIAGYSFVRTVSASIFMDFYGVEQMPWAMALSAVGIFILIYLYNKSIAVLGALRAIIYWMGGSAVMLLLCHIAISAGLKPAGYFLFVFSDIYIVILSEHYWSFINSILSCGQGKLLNGPVSVGAALGAVLSNLCIAKYAGSIGADNMIFVSAGFLAAALITLVWAYKKAGEPKPRADERRDAVKHPLQIKLFLKTHPLLILAGIVFMSQIIAAVAGLNLYSLVEKEFADKTARTVYLAGFWMKTNSLGFILQLIITPLFLSRMSIRTVMIILPALHLINAAVSFFHGGLFTAALYFGIYKSLEYSLFRAGKELFYIPLSYNARYEAKQIVDSFCYRVSKGFISAVIGGVKIVLGAVSLALYPAIGFISALVWLYLAFPLTKKPNCG